MIKLIFFFIIFFVRLLQLAIVIVALLCRLKIACKGVVKWIFGGSSQQTSAVGNQKKKT
jgi:hypothetical protein